MKAAELCIRDVVTARPEESVVDAARRMADQGVGDLVVIDDADGMVRPIGIVTDRDLVTRALAHGMMGLTLREVMRANLVTAVEDDDVDVVLIKLKRHAIRRVPVVNTRGGLEGIITFDDVIAWITEQMNGAATLLDRQARASTGAARVS